MILKHLPTLPATCMPVPDCISFSSSWQLHTKKHPVCFIIGLVAAKNTNYPDPNFNASLHLPILSGDCFDGDLLFANDAWRHRQGSNGFHSDIGHMLRLCLEQWTTSIYYLHLFASHKEHQGTASLASKSFLGYRRNFIAPKAWGLFQFQKNPTDPIQVLLKRWLTKVGLLLVNHIMHS